MARTLLVTGGTPRSTSANVTSYISLGNAHLDALSTSESLRHVRYRTPGGLSNLYVRVTVNAIAGSSTVNVRKNATNTTLSVSIGNTLTGFFEDTTNETAIAAGDEMAYRFVPGHASNTMTISLLSVTFDADTNTVTRMVGGNTAAIATASVSRYNQLTGVIAGNISAESSAKTRIRVASTGKNLGVNVGDNARTTTTTVKSRKNGADGAMSIPIATLLTGWFEDITNSDTLAAGDDYNTVVVTLTGTETLTIRAICVDLETTSAKGTLVTARGGSLAQAASVTNYLPIGGDLVGNTTEADVKVKARDIFTFSELSILVTANTVTAASTLKLRKNGVDTSMVVTINASTVGLISDSTHTETVAATDDLNLILTTGGTGTTLTARAVSMNALGFERRIRTASDTITVAEASMIRLDAKIRAITDTSITVGEAIARVKAAFRALSQTVTVGEAIAKLITKVRALSDTITIGEALATIAGKVRALAADTITIGENVVRVVVTSGANIVKTLSETDIISEGIGRLKAVWRLQP